MKKLIIYYLPDCNVIILVDERLHKSLALHGFDGTFYLISYKEYADTGRQESPWIGISDAPTVTFNGDILRGVQSDSPIGKYHLKLLAKS